MSNYDIEPVSLELKAFRSFEHMKYDFPGSGLYLVEGENVIWSAADSNGAGKTTIADGLCWTIFGETLGGEKGADIVNNRIQANTMGRFKFRVDGDLYTISRYEAHEKFKNQLFFKGGEAILTGATKTETQEKINGVLGMDHKTFTTAVVVEEFPFTGASDAEQKRILDRILGLEGLQRAKQHTSDLLKDKRNELKRLGERVESLEEKWQAARDYISDLKDKDANYAKGKKNRVKELQADLASEQDKLDRLGKEDFGDKRTPIREKIIELKGLIAEEPTFRKKLDKAQERKSELRGEVSVLEREDRELGAKIHRLESLGDECDKCEQGIEHKHIELKIKEHQKELKEAADKLVAMREAIDNNRSRIDKLNDLLDSIKADRDRLDELERKDRALVLLSKEHGHKMDLVRRNIGSIQGQIDNADTEASPYQALVVEEVRKKKELNAKAARLYDEREGLEREIRDLEFAEEAFGNAGIRSYVFDSVAVTLNKLIKELSRKVTDGKIQIRFVTQSKTKKGELREKFHVEVINRLGGDQYKINSRGERKRIDGCVMLALNFLMRTRNNRKIKILWLDEFLDGLDRTGRERMIKVLQEESKDCWIAVVTHSHDMRPMFRKVIKVRKDGDYSVLV